MSFIRLKEKDFALNTKLSYESEIAKCLAEPQLSTDWLCSGCVSNG
jgi:hypothetical protein